MTSLFILFRSLPTEHRQSTEHCPAQPKRSTPRFGPHFITGKILILLFSLNSLRNTKRLVREQRISISVRSVHQQLNWETRFLGVFFDHSLTWRKHVYETRRKILPCINVMKALAGIRWNPHLSTLTMVYKRFVMSSTGAAKFFNPCRTVNYKYLD